MESEHRKRILYFVPEFPQISETFIEREISKLINLGNLDITVLSLNKATGSTSAEVLNKTVYKRLGLTDFLGGLFYLLTKTNKVVEVYKTVVGTKQRISLYFFLKSLGYAKIISNLKPQHIHAHFLSWPSTTALIASHMLDIPFSISAHARDVFVEGELIPLKIESAKFVSICNSYAYAKALEILGDRADKSKVKLIYHGIDSKMFESVSNLPEWDVPAIFLGGTRLVEKKGLKYMIEASKILCDKGIAHRIDLVGPGNLYSSLIKQIDELNLHNTVFIHGKGKGTPFKEVLEYYKLADIFVLPGIETDAGDVDGVPTVCVEAAMAKLPIISTNAGGITDLIENGVTGLIVEQKDPQAIADSIEKLLQDRAFADRLAQNAYSKAVGMFNIDSNVGQLENLLKN
jgi:colanic acid/amylovoran biosynthesis glycosyltransferase